MPQYKLTIQRGKVDLKDVVVAAGVAEAQSDTMSVNIDATNLTRQDIIIMLEKLQQKVFSGLWPPL